MLAWGRTRVKQTSRRPPLRLVFWAAAVGWMALIFYLSHQSAPLGRDVRAGESFGAHVAMYAVLAALLCWALAGGVRIGARASRGVLAVVAFGLTALYGVSDEVHQAFVAGRNASEADLALNGLGAAAGLVGVLLLDRLLTVFARRRW